MIRQVLNTILISSLLGSVAVMAAGTPDGVPKELMQYVQDARKLGMDDANLKQNALKAGWNADIVDQALQTAGTSLTTADPSGKTSPAAMAMEPKTAIEEAKIPAEPKGPPETKAIPETPRQKPEHGVADEYQIGEGDVIQMVVWKEPDASVQSVVVRADGKISVPFLKEVEVSGKTPAQAEQIITNRLKPFINEPDVTLIIREVHSKKIFMVGAIKKEGAVDLKYPMRVLQAITEAGGLTDYAKRKKIYVLRTEDGRQFRIPFNYDAVIRGEQLEQNIWLVPGDMIVVQH
jgi:polysaccharide biosynthesis/export protein